VVLDSATLKANAAMGAILARKKETTGRPSGISWPKKKVSESTTMIICVDHQQCCRKGEKKVSNVEWKSNADPEARIGNLKHDRTHLNYKAEKKSSN
jgi:hypothetical protein